MTAIRIMASSFSVGVTPDPPGLAKTAVLGQGGTAATPSGLWREAKMRMAGRMMRSGLQERYARNRVT